MSDTATVVIPAAGEGSRLRPHTSGLPKPLLQVGGRPLLGRTLDLLSEVGAARIVIVTGYRGDQIRDFVGRRPDAARIALVENPRWASTNNAFSLSLARPLVGGALLIVDGDLLFDRAAIAPVAGSSADVAIAVERREHLGDEEIKVRLAPDGSIAAISKVVPLPTAVGEAVGIARFAAPAAAALFDRLEGQIARGEVNVFYERAFEEMIAGGWRFSVEDITGAVCMEIDTPADLQRADALARRL